MKGEFMNYIAEIKNPPKEQREGYVVARNYEGNLWYYGTYETEKRAFEVAQELDNGVVIIAKENL